MTKAPAYQHYAQDWLVGTASMTLEAQGAYQRLLDHQWVDGPLPDDLAVLRRLVGLDAKGFSRVWRQISAKFPLLQEGIRANPRLEAERQKQEDYRARQAVSGRAGAEKRHRVAHPDPTTYPPARGVANGQPKPSSSSSSSTSTTSTTTTKGPTALGIILDRQVSRG